MALPVISIVIATFNEEERIGLCLESIFVQDYPKDQLEVFVVDDGSTDNTLNIAKQYPVKIISHISRDPERGKMLAFEKAKGELFIYFDADIHLRGRDWFKKMTKPLINDPKIVASFTRYYSDEHSSPIERYLNLDPLQRDSIYKFFSPNLEELILEKKKEYWMLRYQPNKIPPSGLCLHRSKLISKYLASQNRFLELDLLVNLVDDGNNIFAYVPEAGLFHHHARSLIDLLGKRKRNVTSVYLINNEQRKYRWFNLKNPFGLLKVLLWILWANLFFPSLVAGLYKSIRYKTYVGMYEPIFNILVTDTIIFSFLLSKKTKSLFK